MLLPHEPVTGRWDNAQARTWPIGTLSDWRIGDILASGHVLSLRLANGQLVRVRAKA